MASRMASITFDQKRPSEIGSLFGPRKRMGRRRFMLHRTPFWAVTVGLLTPCLEIVKRRPRANVAFQGVRGKPAPEIAPFRTASFHRQAWDAAREQRRRVLAGPAAVRRPAALPAGAAAHGSQRRCG